MAKEGYKRKISAILSADVVGYSRLMEDDESATVSTLEAYRETIFTAIEDHRGRVVDSPGDNILSEFASVVDAVQCAVEIQQVIKVKNADLSENRRMRFRVGINLGDVIEEGGRIYGDGVNLAARIESLADPGSICISGSAYEQIKSKLALGYQDLGKKNVKNITEPIRVYRIPINSGLSTSDSQKPSKPSRLKWSVFLIIAGILLGVGSILIWSHYLKPSLTQEAVRQSPAERLEADTSKSGEGAGPDAEFLGDLDKTIRQVQTQVREHVQTQLRSAFEGLEGNQGGEGQTKTQIEAAKKDTPAIPMEKPSIAVLPFMNMSGDPDQEYFADGMTEEIITRLSKSSQLSVIARNSTFTYKGKPAKVQQVGRELGARYLVEGSIRKAGNRVRITAQMFDGNTGNHIWSETYDREFDSDKLFDIQDEVAEQIAGAVLSGYENLEIQQVKPISN
jgi:TolB-like protein/class 3 adenylate cyclase